LTDNLGHWEDEQIGDEVDQEGGVQGGVDPDVREEQLVDRGARALPPLSSNLSADPHLSSKLKFLILEIGFFYRRIYSLR